MGAPQYLSKREQQIMEIVHRYGSVSVTDVEAALPGNPANSTVRTMLNILERKGQLVRESPDGGKTIYKASQPTELAGQSALEKLTKTFFGGSVPSVVATLLDTSRERLSSEELSEIEALIKKAREEGR